MYEYKGKAIRVIDGDTIEAEIDLGFNIKIKETIRLYGINTPETRTKDHDEKERGIKAAARLSNLLSSSNNEFVIKTHFSTKEKFNRTLGEIFVKDVYAYNEQKDNLFNINVNKLLVEENHAVKYMI